LTLGNSRSFDSSYLTNRYHSLARFGIGFWSVFTIAEQAIVKTAPFEYLKHSDIPDTPIEGLLFDVSISEAKDYTVFTQCLMQAGTQITLKVKTGVSIDDVLDRLKYHIKSSSIPIEIITDEETFIMPQDIELPSFHDIIGAKNEIVKKLNVTEFVYESKIDDITFKMKILYRMENGRVSFRLIYNNMNHFIKYLNHTLSITHRSVSICGFLSNFGILNRIINIESVCYFCRKH